MKVFFLIKTHTFNQEKKANLTKNMVYYVFIISVLKGD